MVEGPATITREWGQRRITVTTNVRGRDMGSFVAEARRKVAEKVALPQGRCTIEWGGQFGNLERARVRLLIVVPLALVLIFGLLYMTYHNIADALLNGYKRKFLGFRMLPATEDALELLDRIQDRQRGSALAEQAGLRKADYYYNAGKFEDAVAEYTLFLTRYKYSQYVRKAEIRRFVEDVMATFTDGTAVKVLAD